MMNAEAGKVHKKQREKAQYHGWQGQELASNDRTCTLAEPIFYLISFDQYVAKILSFLDVLANWLHIFRMTMLPKSNPIHIKT